jgi:hypothetical protein
LGFEDGDFVLCGWWKKSPCKKKFEDEVMGAICYPPSHADFVPKNFITIIFIIYI